MKAKYDVIEPHYMEGTTPDGCVVFLGPSYLVVIINEVVFSHKV